MKNRIRVLFVVTRCTNSGPINVIDSIISNINREVFDIYLITTSDEDNSKSVLERFKKLATFYHVPLSKIKVLMNCIKPFKRIVETIDPDVIHSNGFVPDLLVSKLNSQKQITTIHCNTDIDYRYTYGRLKGSLLSLFHKALFKRIPNVVCCSKSLSLIYKVKLNMDFVFIRNGVPINENLLLNKNNLRKKMNLPINKKIFVYAATFNPRKNQSFLLKSFSELNDPSIVLLLLGDGKDYKELSNLYSNEGFVIFTGNVNNVKDYLLASDFFVSSSLQEGMPLGVLEGMSVGLPVLLSNIEQHHELFEIDHSIGKEFVSNDSNDFLFKLRELMKEDYANASFASYSLAKNTFNAKLMSEQYQMKYLDIAKRR